MKAILYSPTSAIPFDTRWSGLTIDNSMGDEPLPDFDAKAFMACFWRRILGGEGATPFAWFTHNNERVQLEDMATLHLFYALRMVWNHSVSEIWRVGDYKYYSDVPTWPENYRRRAITELTKELVSRDDAAVGALSEDIRQQFHEIVLKTITILALGL